MVIVPTSVRVRDCHQISCSFLSANVLSHNVRVDVVCECHLPRWYIELSTQISCKWQHIWNYQNYEFTAKFAVYNFDNFLTYLMYFYSIDSAINSSFIWTVCTANKLHVRNLRRYLFSPVLFDWAFIIIILFLEKKKQKKQNKKQNLRWM